MVNQHIDERLQRLLRERFDRHRDEALPHPENRIFTNRNIKLSRIEAVGFDLDFTLAQYEQTALDTLTQNMVLKKLVEKRGYPEGILEITYEPRFAIRGLVVDTQLGNVLKMDKFRYVSLAYHGRRPLDPEGKKGLYNTSRVRLNSRRYRSVDTLFELLETYLYAALIEYLEVRLKREVDYKQLFDHLRDAVDLCHSDGSLKSEITAHPDVYIKDDPMLIPALHRFKESGKRLFVVTNSEPEYTEFVLDHLFRREFPHFRNWRSCFEIVGCAARKPGFFTKGTPLRIIEDDGRTLFFEGGNLDFLEGRLRVKADHVLYVGDHIYGDILKSKHDSCWRTCIIVPELAFQIQAEHQVKPLLLDLFNHENRRKQLTMEINWRRSQVQDLQHFKQTEADELGPGHLGRIDRHIATLNRQLEENHGELSTVFVESRQLRRRISNAFNPYWGRLFKAGEQLSILAEQVRDYACIYTSTVSNFNFYDNSAYLESMVTPMPHEAGLFTVGDLDFDVTMADEDEPEPADASDGGDGEEERPAESAGELPASAAGEAPLPGVSTASAAGTD